MEDKIIELADYFIRENTTYREAKIACEKLLKQVSHEIEKVKFLNKKAPDCNQALTKIFNLIISRKERIWKQLKL